MSTKKSIIIIDDQPTTRMLPPLPLSRTVSQSSISSSQYLPKELTPGISERSRQASIASTAASSTTSSSRHTPLLARVSIEIKIIHAIDEDNAE